MAKLLKKQIPMSPPAEEYSATAFRRTEEAKATTRHILDVAYGPEDDQDIDIYLPDDANATNVPVFMFVHGGSWTHGYKEWMGLMAPALVATPAILVSVSYRLAPECRFPGPLEDCVAALAWVHRHIGEYGGDPGRLFVGGHSAGGHLYTLASLQPARLARARKIAHGFQEHMWSKGLDRPGSRGAHGRKAPPGGRGGIALRGVSCVGR